MINNKSFIFSLISIFLLSNNLYALDGKWDVRFHCPKDKKGSGRWIDKCVISKGGNPKADKHTDLTNISGKGNKLQKVFTFKVDRKGKKDLHGEVRCNNQKCIKKITKKKKQFNNVKHWISYERNRDWVNREVEHSAEQGGKLTYKSATKSGKS